MSEGEAALGLNHQYCRTWNGSSFHPDSHEQSQEKRVNHTHRSSLRELRAEFSYIGGIKRVISSSKTLFTL